MFEINWGFPGEGEGGEGVGGRGRLETRIGAGGDLGDLRGEYKDWGGVVKVVGVW